MTHPVTRLLNAMIAVDQFLNAVLGGRPNETISGTIGRACAEPKPPWWAKPAEGFVDWLFWKGHCAETAVAEDARREQK